MGAFRDFCGWLLGGEAYRLKAKFLEANAVREATCKRLAACRLAGDTRVLHYAEAAYRAATTEALRAELAWRRVQPRQPSRVAKHSAAVGGSR